MQQEIATVFVFQSDTSNRQYQTLQYSNGELSCDCKGWTRRVQPDGSRSCKHVRFVEAGLGNVHAIRVVEKSGVANRTRQRAAAPAGPGYERQKRRFQLEEV